jgi:hypothetical protein
MIRFPPSITVSASDHVLSVASRARLFRSNRASAGFFRARSFAAGPWRLSGRSGCRCAALVDRRGLALDHVGMILMGAHRMKSLAVTRQACPCPPDIVDNMDAESTG